MDPKHWKVFKFQIINTFKTFFIKDKKFLKLLFKLYEGGDQLCNLEGIKV